MPTSKTKASGPTPAPDAKTEPAAPLPGAPAAPPAKASRRDTLHVAYDGSADGGLLDVVMFGTRPEALEHAIDQEPPWKVVALTKGQSILDAINAKEKP